MIKKLTPSYHNYCNENNLKSTKNIYYIFNVLTNWL